jgi:hypothetical protein
VQNNKVILKGENLAAYTGPCLIGEYSQKPVLMTTELLV